MAWRETWAGICKFCTNVVQFVSYLQFLLPQVAKCPLCMLAETIAGTVGKDLSLQYVKYLVRHTAGGYDGTHSSLAGGIHDQPPSHPLAADSGMLVYICLLV
ncbi:TPA: hypothetical protein ACH3X1_014974 [Trebouxia sp. C0004]